MESVKISTNSWHYKLVTNFFFDGYYIQTICGYWVKVWITLLTLFALLSDIIYGFYVIYQASIVENYMLTIFEFVSVFLSLLFSGVVFLILVGFISLAIEDITKNIFRKCKPVKFVNEE